MNNPELAILIPAYNEGPYISSVLDVVCSFNFEKRVVVINDGSTDDTSDRVEKYPVELVSHRKNRGKGAALQTGIDYVGHSRLWLFLDADLINLKHRHFNELLNPIIEGNNVDMTVGVFTAGRKNVDMAQRFFSILNGQRGLSGDFVAELPDLSWSRFGVEVFLSRVAGFKGANVDYPILKGLTHHTKESKLGFFLGFMYRLQMYRECIYALYSWQSKVGHLPAPR